MPRLRSFGERRKQGWREMANPDRISSDNKGERLGPAKLVRVGEAGWPRRRPPGASKTYRLADCVRIYDEWWRKCQMMSRLADRTRCQHEANAWVRRCKEKAGFAPNVSIRPLLPNRLSSPALSSHRRAPIMRAAGARCKLISAVEESGHAAEWKCHCLYKCEDGSSFYVITPFATTPCTGPAGACEEERER